MTFCDGRVRQSMFRTDTTGTPTRIKRVHRASVSAVPEGIISTSAHYRTEWSGITRSVNGSNAAYAVFQQVSLKWGMFKPRCMVENRAKYGISYFFQVAGFVAVFNEADYLSQDSLSASFCS